MFTVAEYAIGSRFLTQFLFYSLILPGCVFFGLKNKQDTWRVIHHPVAKIFFILFAFIIFHALCLTVDKTDILKTIGDTLATGLFFLASLIFFAYEDRHLTVRFF